MEAKDWLKEKNYYDYLLNIVFEQDIPKEKSDELEKIKTVEEDNIKENKSSKNDHNEKEEFNNVTETYVRQDYKIMDKYIGANTNYNTIEMLFYKARAIMGVNELRIIKKSRIKGYKTILIVSKLVEGKSYERITDLERYIDRSIIGEEIKLVVYTPEKEAITSNILGINEENIIIDEKSRKIDIVLESSRKGVLDCEKEKIIISEILPYYKIQFFYSDNEYIENNSNIKKENSIIEEKNITDNKQEKDEIESSKEVEDAVDSILNIFFK